MNRDELLAAVIAERNDYRWFKTPEKTAADINVNRDDELTCARRLRSLDADMGDGRWVVRRGIKAWEAAS